MDIFTVICRSGAGETFKIHLLAESEVAAAAAARERGLEVDQVLAPVRPRRRPAWIERGRPRGGRDRSHCDNCGYSLRGLPVEGRVIRCPECGREQAIA